MYEWPTIAEASFSARLHFLFLLSWNKKVWDEKKSELLSIKRDSDAELKLLRCDYVAMLRLIIFSAAVTASLMTEQQS